MVARWSALRSSYPEAVSLSPGCFRKSIWHKARAKYFIDSCRREQPNNRSSCGLERRQISKSRVFFHRDLSIQHPHYWGWGLNPPIHLHHPSLTFQLILKASISWNGQITTCYTWFVNTLYSEKGRSWFLFLGLWKVQFGTSERSGSLILYGWEFSPQNPLMGFQKFCLKSRTNWIWATF